MSLLAASKITGNDELRARVEAAIRKTAVARMDHAGSDGQLAQAGYTAPETVSGPFMLRVATNGDIAAKACEGCGRVTADDSTIEWIVGDAWEAVAAAKFPEPPADATA